MVVQVLNVAEKNDAAKNIAELLSRGQMNRREGRSKFNKVYEFNHHLFNESVKMTVTSVSGHLLCLDFVGNYKKWQAVNPVTLFEAPIEKFCATDYQAIKSTLEEETRKSKYLVIWTDCDREGENIGYEVIQVCRAVKSNIQVFRAKFSEITYQSVSRALQNLGPPNKNISDAVDVRQELDLRIGAAFTRFQTLRLQQVYPQTLGSAMISYGSCQFPTLGFIVERYRSIQDFVREPFWYLKVSWEPNENEKVDFLWKRNHLFDQNVVQILLDKCQENPEAEVTKMQTKSKSKWRPLPLDTVELEKLGSRKLRINAKEMMKIAEKLYTQGYISYPRTETNIFPKELDLRPLVEMQTTDASWGGFARRVLDQGIHPRQGKKSDQAHPPIHPTKYAAQLGNDNERKVYEFIVRHFLACVSADAQGFETVAEIEIQQEEFVASGLQIVAHNYLEVYPYDRWSDRSLPQFTQGQRFNPSSITMQEGETSPPNLLSEADLISLMEKHGIGTDATHAEHIETIKTRMYAGVQGDGRFLPRSLGMGLVQGYDAMGIALSKPNLRAELEADLKRVCDGLRSPQEVLQEQIDKYRRVFVQAMEQITKMDDALSEYIQEERQPARNFVAEGSNGSNPAYRKCPQCNLDLTLRTRRESGTSFFSCMGYPNCKVAIWFPANVQQVQILTEACPRCPGNLPLLRFKFAPGAYAPFYSDTHTGCIGGCDTNFLELLSIRPFVTATRPATAARPVGTEAPVQRGRPIGLTNQNDTNRSAASSGYFSNASQSRNGSGSIPHDDSRETGASRPGNSSSYFTQQSSLGNGSSVPGGEGAYRSSMPPPPGHRSNGNAGVAQQQTRRPPPSMDDSESAVVCNCNENAMLLTVRKEGPNTGRQFYKCPKPQGAGCDFFLWADGAAPPPASQVNGTRSTVRETNSRPSHPQPQQNRQDDGDATVVCSCGEPARLLTVHKDGPNKGRQFYGCPKPYDVKCNFFQWADEAGSSGGGGGGGGGYGGLSAPGPSRGRGRGRGRGGGTGGGQSRNTGGGERKTRKCGQCGEEGHTRNRCPDLE